MEKRKLQKTGGSSFTITLPKKWVNQWHLTDKEELDFFSHQNGQLCIRPHSIDRKLKAVLNIHSLSDEYIEREIIGLYVWGANEICIKAEMISSYQRSLLRNVSHKLFGFELYDSALSYVVLKNVSTNTIGIPENIDRMLSIIIEMYTDLLTALDYTNKQLARDIEERDVEIDRIHLLIERIFYKNLGTLIPEVSDNTTLTELALYNAIGIRLERIADHITRIAKIIQCQKEKTKLRFNKGELSDIHTISDYLKLLKKVISLKHKRYAHELLDMYSIKEKYLYINKIIYNKQSYNIIIDDSIERIRSYSANIAEEIIKFSSINVMYRETEDKTKT